MRVMLAEDSLMVLMHMIASQTLPASGVAGELGEGVLGREDWLPGAIAALGIAMITSVLLRRWFRKSRRANEDRDLPVREQRERLQNRAERDSLDQLMVEVQELTRVCAAQIENRATKLEYLIELADQRLRELERACSNAEAASSAPARPATHSQRTGSESRPAHSPASRDWSESTEQPHTAVQTGSDTLARRIHELSQMGLKSVEIARQLDEQVGKVELILALGEAS
jgi:hypothetical protein